MHSRDVSRWLSLLFIVGGSALTVAACGSSGSTAGSGGLPDGSLSDVSLSLGDGATSKCQPKSCKDLGYTCGINGDTCGGMVDCGSCTLPEYCGGGGYSKCGGNVGQALDGATICTPKTCADFPVGTCGKQSDGCGHLTDDCLANDAGGHCAPGQFCGGGGPGICGTGLDGGAEAGVCTPLTCANYPTGTCGQQTDGCAGLTDVCGTNDAGNLCPSGQYCGGGGPGLCGTGPTQDAGADGGICPLATCASLGNPCGTQGDGCGGTISCAVCSAGTWCGGGGPNQCGNGFTDGGAGDSGLLPPCVPTTCADYPTGTCGQQSDGCGSVTANCSTCAGNGYCGGGGPNLCGTGLPTDGGT